VRAILGELFVLAMSQHPLSAITAGDGRRN